MGMYDSVNFRCQECGSVLEFQSKSGECSLRTFSPSFVPLDVVHGILECVEHCWKCKKAWKAKAIVQLDLVEVDPNQAD